MSSQKLLCKPVAQNNHFIDERNKIYIGEGHIQGHISVQVITLTPKGSILLSYRCCNKLPHIQWLIATQIYYLTVPQVRDLTWSHWAKLKVLAVLHSFLETLGRIHFFALSIFQKSPASLACVPFFHLQSQKRCMSLILFFSVITPRIIARKDSLPLRIHVIRLSPLE